MPAARVPGGRAREKHHAPAGGRAARAMRSAARRAKRSVTARRRAGASRASIPWRSTSPPQPSARISPCSRRQELVREPVRHGEVEPVAPVEIVRPFAVRLKVRPAGFHLDAPDLARRPQRAHIHPPPAARRHLDQRREAEVEQHPADAARDQDAGGEIGQQGHRQEIRSKGERRPVCALWNIVPPARSRLIRRNRSEEMSISSFRPERP